VCGIFDFDVSFTLFYNTPPRIHVSELLVDMPCSLPVYLAQSPAECYQALLAEQNPTLPLLAELVQMYFSDNWTIQEQVLLTGVTVLHHFVLILGL
jgi:hypothetical protein